jgi:hypothetical protein
VADKRDSERKLLTGAQVADGDLWEGMDISDPSMAASGTNFCSTTVELAVALATRIKAPVRLVIDANATVVAGDEILGFVSLTAARSISLPATFTFGAGRRLVIYDVNGSASATNTLTVQRAGTDTISGANTHIAVSIAYGARTYLSDGLGRWIVAS